VRCCAGSVSRLMISGNVQVMVFGEITTAAKVDYEAVVRKTCRDIGFTSEDVGLDADTCKVCILCIGERGGKGGGGGFPAMLTDWPYAFPQAASSAER